MTPANIKIIGKGNIGDKAKQLLEKTPQLIQMGFHAPERTVLAEDYFDGFFQKNGLGKSFKSVDVIENLEAKIRRGSLTREEFETLQKVGFSYGKSPLVVRSSAEGDSRGTGIYKTEFCDNEIKAITPALKKVLASYFSENAVLFRKDSGAEKGFGIIIEPIIGQWLDDTFCPVLSGFAYTSTSKGEGYINVVPGIGCGVESRDGKKITKTSLKECEGNLKLYLENLENKKLDIVERIQYGKSVRIKNSINRINLFPFFNMMDEMEKAFGMPQYFEWAMTLEQGIPEYWIIQIADVAKKADIFEFGDLGEIMLNCYSVTGNGMKECSKITYVFNPDELDNLYKFNKENENYVLLYSSRLTTTFLGRAVDRLEYRHVSNAAVLIEQVDAPHAISPIAHWQGKLDVTKKLFGVLDTCDTESGNLDLFFRRLQKEGRMDVYPGKVKVVASERQDRMIVAAIA